MHLEYLIGKTVAQALVAFLHLLSYYYEQANYRLTASSCSCKFDADVFPVFTLSQLEQGHYCFFQLFYIYCAIPLTPRRLSFFPAPFKTTCWREENFFFTRNECVCVKFNRQSKQMRHQLVKLVISSTFTSLYPYCSLARRRLSLWNRTRKHKLVIKKDLECFHICFHQDVSHHAVWISWGTGIQTMPKSSNSLCIYAEQIDVI